MTGYFAELEDDASARFYRELEGDRLMTTRCDGCGHASFPPRSVCPRCLGSSLSWFELPGTGTVYAYTQQHYAIVHTKPEVVGAVDLDGCTGRALAVIRAPLEELDIGMPVEVEYFDSPFGMRLFRFRPP